MSILQAIQKQITEIEARIAEDSGDVTQLKKILNTLRMQEFEEDIREQDNRQFLRDWVVKIQQVGWHMGSSCYNRQ